MFQTNPRTCRVAAPLPKASRIARWVFPTLLLLGCGDFAEPSPDDEDHSENAAMESKENTIRLSKSVAIGVANQLAKCFDTYASVTKPSPSIDVFARVNNSGQVFCRYPLDFDILPDGATIAKQDGKTLVEVPAFSGTSKSGSYIILRIPHYVGISFQYNRAIQKCKKQGETHIDLGTSADPYKGVVCANPQAEKACPTACPSWGATCAKNRDNRSICLIRADDAKQCLGENAKLGSGGCELPADTTYYVLPEYDNAYCRTVATRFSNPLDFTIRGISQSVPGYLRCNFRLSSQSSVGSPRFNLNLSECRNAGGLAVAIGTESECWIYSTRDTWSRSKCAETVKDIALALGRGTGRCIEPVPAVLSQLNAAPP